MSSDYNVSYSYSVGGERPQAVAQDSALYAFEDLSLIHI